MCQHGQTNRLVWVDIVIAAITVSDNPYPMFSHPETAAIVFVNGFNNV